jgi:glutaredoxin 2
MKNKYPQYSLYYYNGCPYCEKTVKSITKSGYKAPNLEARNIMTHNHHKTDLLAGGGKKQVPCLLIETSEGQKTWLYESNDIINYCKNNQL